MERVILPANHYYSEEISPNVFLEKFHPGGKDGPNGEVLYNTIGGQVWTEIVLMGSADDAFQMAIPDIRMPANQYWPLHWHDCWTVVLVVEGECLIGDWLLKAGDIFIAEPSIEYGPLLIGAQGCRLFEIFARLHLSTGGYAPEFRDHPTLTTKGAVFMERSPVNQRNNGRQTMPCGNVPGIARDRLRPGGVWDLGAPGDPDRGVMTCAVLAPGEALPGRTCNDWSAFLVLVGSASAMGRTLGRDDYLLVRPGGTVGEIVGGSEGAQVLELRRTAR